MAVKAAVLLAEGFEEIEALTVVDVLHRAAVDVTTASITTDIMVNGAHAIKVEADTFVTEVECAEFDILILPGGMPGTKNLQASAEVIPLCRQFAEAGKKVAAICAAPIVLKAAGLLEGKKATVYPSFADVLTNVEVTSDQAVIDGNIITGRGAGAAFEFSKAILAALGMSEVAETLQKAMLYI